MYCLPVSQSSDRSFVCAINYRHAKLAPFPFPRFGSGKCICYVWLILFYFSLSTNLCRCRFYNCCWCYYLDYSIAAFVFILCKCENKLCAFRSRFVHSNVLLRSYSIAYSAVVFYFILFCFVLFRFNSLILVKSLSHKNSFSPSLVEFIYLLITCLLLCLLMKIRSKFIWSVVHSLNFSYLNFFNSRFLFY